MQERISTMPPPDDGRLSHPPSFEKARNDFQLAVIQAWASTHPELMAGDQAMLTGFIRAYGRTFGRQYEARRALLPANPAAHPELVEEWASGAQAEWERWHKTSVNVPDVQ